MGTHRRALMRNIHAQHTFRNQFQILHECSGEQHDDEEAPAATEAIS